MTIIIFQIVSKYVCNALAVPIAISSIIIILFYVFVFVNFSNCSIIPIVFRITMILYGTIVTTYTISLFIFIVSTTLFRLLGYCLLLLFQINHTIIFVWVFILVRSRSRSS